MEPITSTHNPHVKLARSLHESKGRQRHGAFLVEGLRLVESAAQATAPQIVLHTPAFAVAGDRERRLLARASQAGAAVRPVSERVLAHVADTVTPQGVVAVVPLLRGGSAPRTGVALDLILDEVGDPGNAGTLVRTAAATGVTRVCAAPGTVDLFAPKVVRAAAGAHFSVGALLVGSWAAIGAALTPGAPVYLADARGDAPYWDVDWTGPAALIVGSEARGASAAARRLVTSVISIPMAGDVESLNAGVAGSVILYEALRQRTST